MQLVKHNSGSRQIDEPWFDLLLRRGQIHGEKGVLGRNNALLTLALAFVSSGKEKENCEYNLYQFNSRLDQPLKDAEVQRIIDSAYSGKYRAAQRVYITQLVQTWVDSSLSEQDLFKNNSNGWYKFAKTREERKNSHFSETEDDLLVYLRKKCTVDKPYLTCTVKELTAELGMSLASFKIIKKRLGAKNKIKFSSTKGRNGRTTLVLIELLVIGVISKNKARKHSYISNVAELIDTTTEQLKRVVAMFTQNNQSLNTLVYQLEFLEVNTS
ncbi:primase C-terminal domain-containing protein [Lactobacillus sp. AN1001]